MNRLLLFTIISINIVPLFCGSSSAKIDKGLLAQRHFISRNVNDNEFQCTRSQANLKGMESFYKMTRNFMNSVLDEDLDVSEILYVENHSLHMKQENLMDYLLSLKGLIALAVCLIIIFAFHMIFSLVMCAVQCFCKPQPKVCNKKADFWPKVICGILLFISFIVLFLALAGAFATNEQLNDGIENIPDSLRNSMKCFQKYLSDTKNVFKDATVGNFKSFSSDFNGMITKSQTDLIKTVDGFIDEANQDLTSFENDLKKIPDINSEFTSLHLSTLQISDVGVKLNEDIPDLREQIKSDLENCGEKCKSININDLKTVPLEDLNFVKITNSWARFNAINKASSNFVNAVDDGKAKITELSNKINNLIKSNLNKATDKIKEIDVNINDNANEVFETIDTMISSISDFTEDTITTIHDYTSEYSEYIHIAGIVISLLILVVLAFVIFALIFGIFCKQPNNKSTGTCSTKSTGSTLLSTMVNLVLILAPVLVVITVFLVPIAMLPDRIICYPLANPGNSKIMDLVNEGIDISNTGLSTTFKDILVRCNQNESAYNVFGLKTLLNLDDIVVKLNIDEFLKNLDITDEIVSKDFSVLTADDLKKMEPLTTFAVEFDFNQFEAFNEHVKDIDYTALINQLKNVKDDIFLSDIEKLQECQDQLSQIKEISNKLPKDAANLKLHLQMGKGSFSEAMKWHIDEIESISTKIRSNMKTVFKTEVQGISENLVDNINTYSNSLINSLQNEVGKCMPASFALNGALSGVCDRVLLPLNGMWMSLVLFEIISVPLVIIALILAGYYRKTTELNVYHGKNSNWNQLGNSKINDQRYRDASKNVHNHNYY